MVFFIFCILLLVPFVVLIAAGILEWKHRRDNGIVNPDYYGVEEDRSKERMEALQRLSRKRERARALMTTDHDEAARLLAEADEEEEQVRAMISQN